MLTKVEEILFKLLTRANKLPPDVTKEDFGPLWQKRKSDNTPTELENVHLGGKREYIRTLAWVIQSYQKDTAFFPTLADIRCIIPHLKCFNKEHMKYFRTGMYQTLLGFEQTCCNNLYELSDKYYMAGGRTESGKPAFYLVCVYLFSVAMNITSLARKWSENELAITGTDLMPIPMSMQPLFESSFFAQCRKAYLEIDDISALEMNQADLLKTLREFATAFQASPYFVALYTKDWASSIKTPKIQGRLDCVCTSTGPQGTFFPNNTYDMTKVGAPETDKLFHLVFMFHTYIQDLPLELPVDLHDNGLSWGTYIKACIFHLLKLHVPEIAATTNVKENDHWVMALNSNETITYTVDMADVVNELGLEIRAAENIYNVKQLFLPSRLVTLMRKHAEKRTTIEQAGIICVQPSGPSGKGGWDSFLPIMDNGRWHHTMAVYKKKVYCAGGVGSDNTVLATIIMYDHDLPKSGWKFIGSMTTPRTNHAMAITQDGKTLVISGGRDHLENVLNSAETFTVETMKAAPIESMRVARTDHAMAVFPPSNVIVVTGGRTKTKKVLDSVETWDLDNDSPEWVLKKTMTHARANHAMVCYNNEGFYLIVTGGEGKTGSTLDTVEVLSSIDGGWTLDDPLPAPRANHAMGVVADGAQPIISGGTDKHGFILDTVMQFNNAAWTWWDYHIMPDGGRTNHAMVVLGGPIVLCVGGKLASSKKTEKVNFSYTLKKDEANDWVYQTLITQDAVENLSEHRINPYPPRILTMLDLKPAMEPALKDATPVPVDFVKPNIFGTL